MTDMPKSTHDAALDFDLIEREFADAKNSVVLAHALEGDPSAQTLLHREKAFAWIEANKQFGVFDIELKEEWHFY